MQQPLISVITPTYNHCNYIIDCIKSVQAQSYSNWEMLIINDGSTDNTGDIVKEYILQSGDTRVKLFNQVNVGMYRLAETYNFALEQSKGEYIGILEGDDLWEPTKLERQIEIVNKHPETILFWGQSYLINSSDLSTYKLFPMIDRLHTNYYNNTPIGSILNLMFFENTISALTMLIRKSVLIEIGGFRQSHNLPIVDLPTILELSLKGTFYFDEFPYSKWRYTPNNATKKYALDMTKGRYDLSLEYYRKAKKNRLDCITISENEISNYFNKLMVMAYARSGRYKLTQKDFSGARNDYKNAIFYRGISKPIWRLRATVGYAFSILHLDVEWLAKLLGKKAYK